MSSLKPRLCANPCCSCHVCREGNYCCSECSRVDADADLEIGPCECGHLQCEPQESCLDEYPGAVFTAATVS